MINLAVSPGSLVHVTGGELAGLTGRLIETPPNEECLIEARALGSGVYVRVPRSLIEPAR